MHAGDLQPAMWRYRARITLEHLTHALQQNTRKDLVVLKEFLRLVTITGAVLNDVLGFYYRSLF